MAQMFLEQRMDISVCRVVDRELRAFWLLTCELRLAAQTLKESMHITQHPEVTDQATLEGEHRCSVPPHVATGRWHTEQFLPVEAMKAELAEDLVSLFHEGQDVAGVASQRSGDRFNVADELLMSDKRRAQ